MQKTKSREALIILILFITTGATMAIRFGITNTFAYIGDITFTPAEVSLVMSVHALAWGFSSLFFGVLAGKLKKEKLFLIGGLILASVLQCIVGFAQSMHTVILLRVLIGIAQGPLLPLLQTLAREVSAPNRVGMNQGILIAGTSLLGSSLPAAIIPTVSSQAPDAWRMPMIVIAVIGVAMALVLWLVYPKQQQEVNREATEKESVQSLKWKNIVPLFKIHNFRLSMIGAIGAIGWTLCLNSFTASYLELETEASTTRLSLMISIGGIMAMISNIFLPALSDKIGRKKCYMICACGMILSPLSIVLLRSMVNSPLVLILYALGQLMGACAMALGTYVIVGDSVPKHLITIGYSICLFLGEILGGTAGPAVAGIFANKYGYIAGVIMAAGFGCVCLIISFFFKETVQKKDMADA